MVSSNLQFIRTGLQVESSVIPPRGNFLNKSQRFFGGLISHGNVVTWSKIILGMVVPTVPAIVLKIALKIVLKNSTWRGQFSSWIFKLKVPVLGNCWERSSWNFQSCCWVDSHIQNCWELPCSQFPCFPWNCFPWEHFPWERRSSWNLDWTKNYWTEYIPCCFPCYFPGFPWEPIPFPDFPWEVRSSWNLDSRWDSSWNSNSPENWNWASRD